MSGRDIPFCWWCGKNAATTREHRVKRSRVEQENARGGGSFLYSADPKYPHPAFLRSSDAKAAKFGKTMCAECNGARSQSFDHAYQHFFDWSLAHISQIRNRSSLSWKKVFADKPFDQRHLIRYYVKNICCRIVDTGFNEVPDELIAFLDNIDHSPVITSVIFKDFGLFDAFAESGESEPHTSPYIQEALSFCPDQSPHPGTYYVAFHEGFFGVLVVWYAQEYRATIKRKNSIEMRRNAKLYDRKRLGYIPPLFDKREIFEQAVRFKNRGLDIMDYIDVDHDKRD